MYRFGGLEVTQPIRKRLSHPSRRKLPATPSTQKVTASISAPVSENLSGLLHFKCEKMSQQHHVAYKKINPIKHFNVDRRCLPLKNQRSIPDPLKQSWSFPKDSRPVESGTFLLSDEIETKSDLDKSLSTSYTQNRGRFSFPSRASQLEILKGAKLVTDSSKKAISEVSKGEFTDLQRQYMLNPNIRISLDKHQPLPISSRGYGRSTSRFQQHISVLQPHLTQTCTSPSSYREINIECVSNDENNQSQEYHSREKSQGNQFGSSKLSK